MRSPRLLLRETLRYVRFSRQHDGELWVWLERALRVCHLLPARAPSDPVETQLDHLSLSATSNKSIRSLIDLYVTTYISIWPAERRAICLILIFRDRYGL